MSVPKISLISLFCLLCSGMHAAAASPSSDAVGMVLDVQGPGQISEKGAVGKLQLLAYLRPGMQVSVETGGKASLTLYATRSVYQISGPALLEVGRDRLNMIKGVAPSVKSMTEKLMQAAEATELRTGAMQMRSGMPQIVVTTPPNGAVLLTNRPGFGWKTRDAAAVVDITLEDWFGKVLASGKASEGKWQLPAELALEYAKYYRWTISYQTPEDGRKHSATSDFSLAEKVVAEQLAGLKPAEGAPIEEWVLYATVLQSKGVLIEARSAWQYIARQRPDLQKDQALGR
jgi:hypothetical protein